MFRRMLIAIRESLLLMAAWRVNSWRNAPAYERFGGASASSIQPSGWPRSSDGFGEAGGFSCFGLGIWQQAMPQQRPSSVPQQQSFWPWLDSATTVRSLPDIKRGYKLVVLKLSSKLAVTSQRQVVRTVFMASPLYGSRDVKV